MVSSRCRGLTPIGYHPSPSLAARRMAGPLSPPIHSAGHGFCTGLGANRMSANLTKRPSNRGLSFVHSSRNAISRLLKKFVGELIFAMFPSQAEASRRDDLRYRLRIRYLFASSWLLQRDSGRCGEDNWDANESVGGLGEDEQPVDQRASAVPCLARGTDTLKPTAT